VCEADLTKALLVDEVLPSLQHLVVVSRDEEKDFITETQSTQRAHRESVQTRSSKNVWWLEDLLIESASQTVPAFLAPANQPAFIFYTSGSTGEPKGAVHRQADIFYTNETYCREVLKPRAGDRFFSSSRLPFS